MASNNKSTEQLKTEIEQLRHELSLANRAKEENSRLKQLFFSAEEINQSGPLSLLPFAMQNAGLGFWSVDLCNLTAKWSAEICAILGIDHPTFEREHASSFTVDKFIEYVHPDDQASVGKRVNESIERKQRFNEKYRMRHNDGYYIWVHSIGQTAYADDNTPLHMTGFIWDITENKAMEEQLRELSITDPLTGLHNRRKLKEILEQELGCSKRYGKIISAAVIDIDHFKIINDKHGHDMGDRFLVALANLMRTTFRDVDYLFRYGGEEFVVIMPNISAPEAIQATNRLRKGFMDKGIEGINATLSAGVADSEGFNMCDGYDRLIEIADTALYKAKDSGRNRVCCLTG